MSESSWTPQSMGRKGGQSGTGKAKARTSEQARRAALARWGKGKGDAKKERETIA